MIYKPTLVKLGQVFASDDAKVDTPRVRRLFQKNLKRGNAGFISVLAALAATRVSAATSELNENAENYLSGLVPVDDLTPFGENCLPGQSYQEYADSVHDHDFALGERIHSEHADHKSHLAVPFASRFDSPFSNGHDVHDNAHESHVANHNIAMTDHTEHPFAAGNGSIHARHENHQGHQTPSGHGAHKSADHVDHSENEHVALHEEHIGHYENGDAAHQNPNQHNHQLHARGAHANHTAGSPHPHSGEQAIENNHDAVGDGVILMAHDENSGDDHSHLHDDQAASLADAFAIEASDYGEQGGHSSGMAHDLANALMALAPTSDAGLLSLPPEI